MNPALRQTLIATVAGRLANDPSHDIGHTLRVLRLAERIAVAEGGDLDILVPAALFHDIIVYAKDDPRSKQEADESAEVARKVLATLPDYPAHKVDAVV